MMASLRITNPGPDRIELVDDMGDEYEREAGVRVHLADGGFTFSLDYSNLDDLDATIDMLCEARTAFVAKLFVQQGEPVEALDLGADDVILADGERLTVERTMVSADGVTIRLFADDGSDRVKVVGIHTPYQRLRRSVLGVVR